MKHVGESGLSNLRIRHLQLVESLVDFGALYQAAKAMNMTESTASAMLREVEAAFDVSLFDRTPQGMTLTKAGEIAIGRLRGVSSELAMLTQELVQPEATPVLRIGAVQHTFFGVLQKVVPQLLAEIPCRLELCDATSSELASCLQQDELDCILGRMPEDWIESFQSPAFFYSPLYDEEICVVASPNHPFARCDTIILEDLVKESWVLPKPGSHLRHVLTTAFVSEGLPPPEALIETSSFVFTLPLLTGSKLLTVATRDHGVSYEWAGQVRVLPIKLPQLSPPVAFVAKKRSMKNPAVLTFWELLRRAESPPMI